MLHQSEKDLREFENQLFEIKIKHKFAMTPLREYIEEWLKKALIRITKLENQEATTTIMPPKPQNAPIKESTLSN